MFELSWYLWLVAAITVLLLALILWRRGIHDFYRPRPRHVRMSDGRSAVDAAGVIGAINYVDYMGATRTSALRIAVHAHPYYLSGRKDHVRMSLRVEGRGTVFEAKRVSRPWELSDGELYDTWMVTTFRPGAWVARLYQWRDELREADAIHKADEARRKEEEERERFAPIDDFDTVWK
jgi:hypothetical protein